MRKILAFLLLINALNYSKAQQVNYTITKDEPDWNLIPNLYVSPMFNMDLPVYGAGGMDALNSSSIGWGIRSHAIIYEKIYVDFNYMNGFWNVISNVNEKPRQIELGGAYILKSNVNNKNIKVVISSREVASEKVAFENKTKVTEEIKYINVEGKELKFAGARGGVQVFRSIFDFDVPGTPPVGTKYTVPDDNVLGVTNSFGVYGGWTWGKVHNLHVKLKDGRSRSSVIYNRWYADILLAPYNHTYIKNSPNNDKFASPVGFRIGFDTTNKLSGVTGKIVNAEVGYRPGFNGFYASFNFSFLQLRGNIIALKKSVE